MLMCWPGEGLPISSSMILRSLNLTWLKIQAASIGVCSLTPPEAYREKSQNPLWTDDCPEGRWVVKIITEYCTEVPYSDFSMLHQGLGLEAQQAVIRHYAAHARCSKAQLAIARLDRLARNVAFTSALMDSGEDRLQRRPISVWPMKSTLTGSRS